jgi:hypothetical protein
MGVGDQDCGHLHQSSEESLMQLAEIQEGMRVLFIPRHARGNRQHRDCVRGVVTGKTDTLVLVRYETDRHSNQWC